MTRAVSAILVVLLSQWGAAQGLANPPDAASRLLAVSEGDPMDYAAAARQVGDAALAALLTDETSNVELRLAAVRAAPFARSPERLVTPIVELAHGTDPALAPAALASAWQIAQQLEFAQLEQRESDPQQLVAAVERLRELGDDDDARADLRQLARHVAARLTAVQRDATE